MTTIAEGWETKLLNGFGQLLADGGAGEWNTAGEYADPDVGITIDAIPDTPTRLITLTLYPVDDEPGVADVRMGMQVRVRGDDRDPRIRNDIASAVYLLLHGLRDTVLNGIAVVQVFRTTWAPIGQDAANRYERADTFYVDAMRPTVFNTD